MVPEAFWILWCVNALAERFTRKAREADILMRATVIGWRR